MGGGASTTQSMDGRLEHNTVPRVELELELVQHSAMGGPLELDLVQHSAMGGATVPWADL